MKNSPHPFVLTSISASVEKILLPLGVSISVIFPLADFVKSFMTNAFLWCLASSSASTTIVVKQHTLYLSDDEEDRDTKPSPAFPTPAVEIL